MRVGCGATRGRRNKQGSVEEDNEQLYWPFRSDPRLIIQARSQGGSQGSREPPFGEPHCEPPFS